ncbi:hypothetical protein [Alteribacillus bidgolensis]|uniref:Biotin-requiring enzyme n=1 Tax=Alteribacillus bidgolensis TaxID=930129 RepID=A0A1G8K5Z6_9BACI|nr:hypothetical protein [Alteribacillus bidgolensis]SDI38832.1 hypothetical protein SAMN05216352_10780 [Alteribacillus bidgolensis]
MRSYRTIQSITNGIVEKVFVSQDSFVYEWEPLFIIKTSNDTLLKIQVGVSGTISKVCVHPGDEVFTDLSLAVLKEDLLPTGSD